MQYAEMQCRGVFFPQIHMFEKCILHILCTTIQIFVFELCMYIIRQSYLLIWNITKTVLFINVCFAFVEYLLTEARAPGSVREFSFILAQFRTRLWLDILTVGSNWIHEKCCDCGKFRDISLQKYFFMSKFIKYLIRQYFPTLLKNPLRFLLVQKRNPFVSTNNDNQRKTSYMKTQLQNALKRSLIPSPSPVVTDWCSFRSFSTSAFQESDIFKFQ